MPIYWIVPILFFSISSLFSMLGIGGSVLFIPILYWLGLDFQTEAIPMGLLLNIISSSTAAMTYVKNKLVNWEVAIPFGMAMIVFAPLGAWLNMRISTEPIMLTFSAFMVVSSVSMTVDWQTRWNTTAAFQRMLWFFFRGGAGVFIRADRAWRRFNGDAVVVCAGNGSADGCGDFGPGGGISSLLSHMALAAQPDVFLWVLSGASVFLGSRTGSLFMVKTTNPKGLKTIFSGLLVVVAIVLVTESLF